MFQPILVLSTCGTREEADRIANDLVASRLAACVSIVPGVTSVYRWQEQVEAAAECLLLIKTSEEMGPALEARLKALHSYETPELLTFSISGGSAAYLEWLAAQIGGRAGGGSSGAEAFPRTEP